MTSFLIEFHRLTGDKTLTEFEDPGEAMKARIQREQATDDPAIEIVVINSPSLGDLKVTHSRYFASEPTPVASNSDSPVLSDDVTELTG